MAFISESAGSVELGSVSGETFGTTKTTSWKKTRNWNDEKLNLYVVRYDHVYVALILTDPSQPDAGFG